MNEFKLSGQTEKIEEGSEVHEGYGYGTRLMEAGLLEQILSKIPKKESFVIKSVFEDKPKKWIAQKLGVSRTRIYQIIDSGWAHIREIGEKVGWEEEYDKERQSKEYKEWRVAVLERDNYTCQECGSKDDLDVHHIIMWKNDKDKRYDVSNGLTLCYSCHKEIHPWYRRKGRKETSDVPESNT